MNAADLLIQRMAPGGGTIDAIEQRVRQLETALARMSGTVPPAQASAFVQTLNTYAQPAPSGGQWPPAATPPRPGQMPGVDATPVGSGPLRLSPLDLASPASAMAASPSAPVLAQPVAPAERALKPLIRDIATSHGVDPDLVTAIVRQESGFQPGAVSEAGAVGLMQLMPKTAQGLGINDPRDPMQNLDGGVRHLKDLLLRYRGNIPLALAAYNAGGGAVEHYGGIPPYKETQDYVRRILAMYLAAKQPNTL